ncbi:MAG: mechanosensitive ion channel family protein, partial [Desulfotomaculaceae bacterium]
AGVIEKLFKVTRVSRHKRKTLHSLLMSLTKYTIYTLAVLSVLDVLTVPIVPLLAGAGLASIAVGLGAQSIIKDVITGFFIIFEDQYRVGEYIEINDSVVGTVEELGLRLTTLRLWSGLKYYIANSEIKTVSNYNRGDLRAVVSAVFPYEIEPDTVRDLLNKVCSEIGTEYRDHLLENAAGELVEPPQIFGVTDIEDNKRGGQFTVTALAKQESFRVVERAIRERIWKKSQEHGIAIAYPQQIISSKDNPQLQPVPKE